MAISEKTKQRLDAIANETLMLFTAVAKAAEDALRAESAPHGANSLASVNTFNEA